MSYQVGQAISWLNFFEGRITKFFGRITAIHGYCLIVKGESRTGTSVVDRLSVDDKTITIETPEQ